MMRWLLSRQLKNVLRTVQEHNETVDRLETQVRRLKLQCDGLKEDIQAVSGRVCKVEGRAGGPSGGRPPRDARAPPGGPQRDLELNQIPHGDKAALREYFRLNPPKGNGNGEPN